MRRGDVWRVSLDPSASGEGAKERLAVVVSNDLANSFLQRAQMVPLTSNVERLYPSEAYVTVNGKQHKALADQLTLVGKQRLGKRVGRLSSEDMHAIGQAMMVQLDL